MATNALSNFNLPQRLKKLGAKPCTFENFTILALFTFLAWLQTGCRPAGAEISGKVTLVGAPPPEIVIKFDPQIARLRPNGLTTRHYLVSSEGGLANTFVYLKAGLSNHAFPPASRPVVMTLGTM